MKKSEIKFHYSVLLLILSVFLVGVLSTISILYFTIRCLVLWKIDELKIYYLDCAVSGDQTGNAWCSPLLNKTFKTKGGYEFGNMDETVSSAMGKNEKLKTLSKFGKFIGMILNKIDPEHMKKSIDETP